jgi:hypothetical protein
MDVVQVLDILVMLVTHFCHKITVRTKKQDNINKSVCLFPHCLFIGQVLFQIILVCDNSL